MFKAMGPISAKRHEEESANASKPADDNVVDAEVKEAV
jgi:hypothetical protein